MDKKSILISCGSFNPPTIMHLRLFELAKDHLEKYCGFEVLGGIVSPTHDNYIKKKPSLIAAKHRVEMVELSLKNYDFVRCSKWETLQDDWTRTREVLQEHLKQIHNAVNSPESIGSYFPESLNGLTYEEVTNPKIFRLYFICGGDLLESFSVPKLWKEEDIETIVRDFGLLVITREGSNPEEYIKKHPILNSYTENIQVVRERISNDISSTKIREALKKDASIRFFVMDEVIEYIRENKLYRSTL